MIYKDENGEMFETFPETFTEKRLAYFVSKLIRGKYVLCDLDGNERPYFIQIGDFDFKSEATAWSVTAENLQKKLDEAKAQITALESQNSFLKERVHSQRNTISTIKGLLDDGS